MEFILYITINITFSVLSNGFRRNSMTGEKNRFQLRFGLKTTSAHDKMAVELYKCKQLRQYIGHGNDNLPIHVELEVPINDARGYTVGFWDCVVYVNTGTSEERHCFELKPLISSIGELLRQIQLYRQHPVRGHFHFLAKSPFRIYLWTRDPRFADLFEGHGIKVFIRGDDRAKAFEAHIAEMIDNEEQEGECNESSE
jgi:hypothetical protein